MFKPPLLFHLCTAPCLKELQIQSICIYTGRSVISYRILSIIRRNNGFFALHIHKTFQKNKPETLLSCRVWRTRKTSFIRFLYPLNSKKHNVGAEKRRIQKSTGNKKLAQDFYSGRVLFLTGRSFTGEKIRFSPVLFWRNYL